MTEISPYPFPSPLWEGIGGIGRGGFYGTEGIEIRFLYGSRDLVSPQGLDMGRAFS